MLHICWFKTFWTAIAPKQTGLQVGNYLEAITIWTGTIEKTLFMFNTSGMIVLPSSSSGLFGFCSLKTEKQFSTQEIRKQRKFYKEA